MSSATTASVTRPQLTSATASAGTGAGGAVDPADCAVLAGSGT
ncbi:hypothetical protein [Rhodococcus qingshengii]|nr:hypothetical protein [Rhodococcus qingshengii]